MKHLIQEQNQQEDQFLMILHRSVGLSIDSHRDHKSTQLKAGYAYNIIWVIYNNPENCFDDPCSITDLYFNSANLPVAYIATGKIAGSGSEKFTASLDINDTSKDPILDDMTSYGLREPLTAEIHIALRSHGPAITGHTQLQTTTYLGGCTINFSGSGNTLEVPDEEGECATLQVSYHQAPE